MPYFGIEEEVFVTEPEKPTLKSLYYLAKVLWKDPRFYYTHTASNFSRGKDISSGLMSGIEIATGVHSDIDELFNEFIKLRRELSSACSGLIVPLGHLLTGNTTTKTCALHVHIGNIDHPEKAYANLVRYLPVLSLALANAPSVNGEYFGKSFRMMNSFAIGDLTGDPYDRMQDIIFSKRLGTIEIRVFDPVSDISRIKEVIKAVRAIITANLDHPLDIKAYNRLREIVATKGIDTEIINLFEELQEIYSFPMHLIEATESDQTWEIYKNKGLVECYKQLDSVYRQANRRPGSFENPLANMYYSTLGFLGYYLPKAPYIIWKYLKER